MANVMEMRKANTSVLRIGELSLFAKSYFCDDLAAVDLENNIVLPGFCDVHVHFREPGFSYKETIVSGSRSAARGGYTDVCTMPNLNPVPDSAEHLREQLELIAKGACIGVYPYGSITPREPALACTPTGRSPWDKREKSFPILPLCPPTSSPFRMTDAACKMRR